MALTQDDINNIVNGIVNTYTNQRIAYHGGYPGECTSPVKYYVENITGKQAPYMANDRADGWGTNFPAELAPFFYHEAYQPGKAYPRGTIFMWNAPHIAINLYDTGSTTITVFEQNADPDGSPCGSHTRTMNGNPWHLPTYALTPIVTSEQATPPPPPAPKYTVIETYPQGKQIQLNKQPTNLWGMNYDFNYMKDHPVEFHNQGEIWTVTNKVHHIDGYDYYRRDGQVDGFNVADCDDYTPPAPPYVPPAAPVTVQMAEKYTLIVPCMAFTTAKAAQNHSGTANVLDAGDYYVWDKADGVKLIGRSNTKRPDPEAWVNVADNKVEAVAAPNLPVDAPATDINLPTDPAPIVPVTPVQPVPAVPKLHFSLITPIMLSATISAPKKYQDVENPSNPNVIELTPGKAVEYSMTTTIDGQTYYIPTFSMKRGWRHAVPSSDIAVPTNKHPQTPAADMYDWVNYLETGFKSARVFISDITKPDVLKPVVEKSRQFIDGFTNKRSK